MREMCEMHDPLPGKSSRSIQTVADQLTCAVLLAIQSEEELAAPFLKLLSASSVRDHSFESMNGRRRGGGEGKRRRGERIRKKTKKDMRRNSCSHHSE